MSSPAEIHKDLAQAWNSRDFKRLRGLMHDEYSYTGGDGKEHKGPDEGLKMSQMYASAFPDGKLEVKRVYTQGNTAIAEMVGRGTHGGEFMGVAPTHRQAEIAISNIIELRDGKIYREREYMCMLNMMTQLGVMALPGHAKGAA